MRPLPALLPLCLLLCACATPSAPRATSTSTSGPMHAASPLPADGQSWATDRSEEDRALDTHRQPAQMLELFQAHPGMRAADLGAGGGYTTELLARTAGPGGRVFSQNPPEFLRFAQKPWTARLQKPALGNVVRVERPMDDPLPPEAHDLDLVVSHAVYHDAVWMNADRDRMNKAVFAALKPGGAYVVIDSSARPGSGAADAKTLHRIDEKLVTEEVERAGFKLERSSDQWRNPEDTRDWSASPGAVKGEQRGSGDRFALRFVRP